MLEKSHVAVITVHVQKLDLCRTWQSASLSFRKQQRNGLSGTVKSFNFFSYLRRKVELWYFLLTRQVSEKVSCVHSSHEVLKWRLGCSR